MSQSVPPPKPFMMTVTDAASVIQKKIERGALRIVVPWQYSVILALSRLVPQMLVRAVLRRV